MPVDPSQSPFIGYRNGALHVEDVDRTIRFYTDVLGLSQIPRPNFQFPGAWFRIGADQELHIIGGALVIFYLWGPGSRMWKTDPERFTNRVEVSGLFWHFVDLVWIFLFPVLYLL